MPVVYSNINDGHVNGPTISQANLGLAAGLARNANTGASVNAGENATSQFAQVTWNAARGGGHNVTFIRSFMYFDTSGINNNILEDGSLKLNVFGFSQNDGSVIAVKSTAFGGDGNTALAVEDFNAINGFVTSDLEGANDVVVYGSQVVTTNWSTSAYNAMDGTGLLGRDMAENDAVIICFMDYTYDFRYSFPSSTGTYNQGATFANYSGTSRDPYIEYTYAPLGVGQVNTVTAVNLGSVIEVELANIAKIITVD
jgi:hypothetical protein